MSEIRSEVSKDINPGIKKRINGKHQPTTQDQKLNLDTASAVVNRQPYKSIVSEQFREALEGMQTVPPRQRFQDDIDSEGIDTLRYYIDTIEIEFPQANWHERQLYLTALGEYSGRHSEATNLNIREIASQTLAKHLLVILEGLEHSEGEDKVGFLKLMDHYFSLAGDEEVLKDGDRSMLRFITQNKDDQANIQLVELFQRLARSDNPRIQQITRGLTHFFVYEYFNKQIDLEKLIPVWDETTQSDIRDFIDDDLSALVGLEAQHPGIGSFANKYLGICQFGRYSSDYLIHKYQEFKAQPTDYDPFRGEKTQLQQFGIEDPDILLSAWRIGYSEIAYAVNRNLLRIGRLENDRPGITRTLIAEFGIKCFSRYPAELLISQYDERNMQRPYGIILYPRSDRNEAFNQNQPVFSELYHEFALWGGDRLLIRVIECGSKKEVIQRLLALNKRYGDANKISFDVLGGHGTINSIELGSAENRREVINITDVANRRTRLVEGFFKPQAPHVLVSCSTGVNKGIAEELSAILGTTVYAPDQDTNISSLKPLPPTELGAPITFQVEYKKPSTRKYIAGVISNSED